MKSIALIGNPNSGKSTLFNLLTGAKQRVGNFTGVTVEKKTGKYKKDKRVEFVDLPGLYSLSGGSLDEKVVIDYFKSQKPTAIINVIDGTNLDRNLYLTCELLNLGIPLVVAVNFCDQLKSNGVYFNATELSKRLGVKVVEISALKNTNIDKLIKQAVNEREIPKPIKSEKGYYSYIDLITKAVINRIPLKSEIISNKIDGVLMHKYLGLPLMFLAVFFTYFLSFRLGGIFSKPIENHFDKFSTNLSILLNAKNVSPWLIDLLCGAVVKGVGGVLGFLPQILILMLFTSVMEESGYSSRIAFNLDRLFRFVGLSGKSVIPLTVSCGCAVTGIMATRNIDGDGERKATVFLSPMMPCSAKTAVFGWFSKVLFNGSAMVATSMYFLSIITVVVSGRILKKFKAFRGEGNFILEIPTLRTPSIKNISISLLERTKDFLIKAGSVIFLVSLGLWCLKSFGLSGYVGENVSGSFLYSLGNILKYLFYPLGFTSWETAISVISGIFAKEAVIETLEIVSSNATMLFSDKFVAYAFQAFILLSPPCMAALAVARRELKNNKTFCLMMAFQFIVAYLVAFIINVIGKIIIYGNGLILSVFIGIIIAILVVRCVIRLKKPCKNCDKGVCKCQKKKRCMT